MAHYRPARPWCELVLGQQMPIALAGATSGLSLLFPMNRLFERMVANSVRRELSPGVGLTEQSPRHSLCTHQERPMFKLKPDMLVEGRIHPVVLDAKWKLIDATRYDECYGLAQADFYQLYAYGQKYMDGRGRMALVYPRTSSFPAALPPFSFGNGLELHVLPFDLETCRVERLGETLGF